MTNIRIIAQWNYSNAVSYRDVTAESVTQALGAIYAHPSFTVPPVEVDRMVNELLASPNKRVEGHSWFWLVRVLETDKREPSAVFADITEIS